MSFTNLYYKRTAGTSRSCYVCCKPTTTVLATLNTTDFLYTCLAHLTDRGFATPVGEAGDGAQGARKLGMTPEEIAKVKEEWEEVQKKKAEKEKVKGREETQKGQKVDQKKEDEAGRGQDILKDKEPEPDSKSSPTLPHERYALHRDYFAMRLAEHRKRRQAAQAKELAPRLPTAPSGAPL
ncbi:hypothetical protein AX15_002555 [Amanita polypyramis BW_CC]|nr:hypothetical protein AX15_002555 [Amanita polypyramis BW_CC]